MRVRVRDLLTNALFLRRISIYLLILIGPIALLLLTGIDGLNVLDVLGVVGELGELDDPDVLDVFDIPRFSRSHVIVELDGKNTFGALGIIVEIVGFVVPGFDGCNGLAGLGFNGDIKIVEPGCDAPLFGGTNEADVLRTVPEVPWNMLDKSNGLGIFCLRTEKSSGDDCSELAAELFQTK